MNPHAQWRLDFAHALSTRLHQFKEIKAIVVIGSVARGYSDVYSDLEVMLVWKYTPGPDLQHAVVQQLQAERRYREMDPGYHSAFRIHGLPVDIWHTTAQQEEATIQSVLHEYNLDLVANNRLDCLRVGIPLQGAELVQQWKDVIQVYPEELAIRLLQTYLPHFHMRQLNLAARRNNPTAFFHTLTDIQCSLFLVLLALNKVYFPTFKWMYPVLDELPVAPTQIAHRLQQMCHEPPLEVTTHLRDVLAETLALVQAHYPQLDTSYARFGLEQIPQATEQMFQVLVRPDLEQVIRTDP